MALNITDDSEDRLVDLTPFHGTGFHGIAHMGSRVLENGLKPLGGGNGALASRSSSSFCDPCTIARRLNEGDDPEHGGRAAELARDQRGGFELSDR